jgi:hypothetical protein
MSLWPSAKMILFGRVSMIPCVDSHIPADHVHGALFILCEGVCHWASAVSM